MMLTDAFTKLSTDLRHLRSKLAFVPTPGGAPPSPPVDPAMAGGAPPAPGGMPPMDPAMMAAGGGAPPMPGGAPPMDPAMMAAGGGAPPMPGGAPPMDPAMAGAPMDPAMAGGAPPMDPAMAGAPMDPAMAGGAPDGMVSLPFSQLLELIGMLVGGRADSGASAPASGGAQAPGAGPAKPKKQTTDQKLDMLLQAVGLPAQPADAAGGEKVGSVTREAKLGLLVTRVLSPPASWRGVAVKTAAQTGPRLTAAIASAAARRMIRGG